MIRHFDVIESNITRLLKSMIAREGAARSIDDVSNNGAHRVDWRPRGMLYRVYKVCCHQK